MTTISIIPEPAGADGMAYRAFAGRAQSVGKTPGEALDAVTAQLDPSESGSLLVVHHFQPDRFFGAEQVKRLDDLMCRWRTARDNRSPWSAEEQAELDALVEQELRAAGDRAAALASQLTR